MLPARRRPPRAHAIRPDPAYTAGMMLLLAGCTPTRPAHPAATVPTSQTLPEPTVPAPTSVPPPDPTSPTPLGPRLDEVRAKSSHNSYERDEALFDQLVYHRVRSIELDIHVAKGPAWPAVPG